MKHKDEAHKLHRRYVSKSKCINDKRDENVGFVVFISLQSALLLFVTTASFVRLNLRAGNSADSE